MSWCDDICRYRQFLNEASFYDPTLEAVPKFLGFYGMAFTRSTTTREQNGVFDTGTSRMGFVIGKGPIISLIVVSIRTSAG